MLSASALHTLMARLAHKQVHSSEQSDQYLQPHRVYTDFSYHYRCRSTDATFLNTERKTRWALTDLPLFRLFHISNQVRGRKRVKPGAVLMVCVWDLGPQQGSAELHSNWTKILFVKILVFAWGWRLDGRLAISCLCRYGKPSYVVTVFERCHRVGKPEI